MKVKVLGFKPQSDRHGLPKAMLPADYLPALQKISGQKFRQLYAGAAPLVIEGSNWWGGIVVRVRDAKSFNSIKTGPDGRRVLAARDLGDDRLAEVCFFIAHPDSGGCLMSKYLHSAPLSDVARLCRKAFHDARIERMNKELEGVDEAAIPAIKKKWAGRLNLVQIKDGRDSAGSRLKEMVSVTRVIARGETLGRHRSLLGFAKKATYIEQEFRLPHGCLPEEIENDFDLLLDAGFDYWEVNGVGPSNEAKKVSSEDNERVFGVWDYDDFMKGFEMDLDKWEESIQQARPIKRLHSLITQNKVLPQLINPL